MQLHVDRLYHIYNRGNNRKALFYEHQNYPFFLHKIQKHIVPYCDLLAYTLMPNHFHLLIHANQDTVLPWLRTTFEGKVLDNGNLRMSQFAHGIQMCLSSYTKAINHQYNRTGSLFTQNTRAKEISSDMFSLDYALWCFIYIHNNPVRAGLVSSPKDWKFSSYGEYLGEENFNLCKVEMGRKLFSLNINQLSSFDSVIIPDEIMPKIR